MLQGRRNEHSYLEQVRFDRDADSALFCVVGVTGRDKVGSISHDSGGRCIQLCTYFYWLPDTFNYSHLSSRHAAVLLLITQMHIEMLRTTQTQILYLCSLHFVEPAYQ